MALNLNADSLCSSFCFITGPLFFLPYCMLWSCPGLQQPSTLTQALLSLLTFDKRSALAGSVLSLLFASPITLSLLSIGHQRPHALTQALFSLVMQLSAFCRLSVLCWPAVAPNLMQLISHLFRNFPPLQTLCSLSAISGLNLLSSVCYRSLAFLLRSSLQWP